MVDQKLDESGERFQRQIAYKVWIKDILNSEYIKQEGFNPNYIQVNGKQISRIQLLATVVSKFVSDDDNYGAVTLDDGTDTIRAKAFGPDVPKIKKSKIGGIVRFVGKIRNYNDETYLSPEIIREVDDPNWIVVHKLELGDTKTIAKVEKLAEDTPKDAAKEEESITKKIVALIRELDEGNGCPMEKLVTVCELEEEETKNIIIGLLKNGEVFEPKKGMIKLLD